MIARAGQRVRLLASARTIIIRYRQLLKGYESDAYLESKGFRNFRKPSIFGRLPRT